MCRRDSFAPVLVFNVTWKVYIFFVASKTVHYKWWSFYHPTSHKRVSGLEFDYLCTLTASFDWFVLLLQKNCWQLRKAKQKMFIVWAVGRAVASDTRDLRFESSHRQILFIVNCIKKLYYKDDENNGPFYKMSVVWLWLDLLQK